MTIKVIIVDDEPLARVSLNTALTELTNWEIVNESASGEQVKELVTELNPQVLFLDIRMPGKSGIDVARELLTLENIPIIVFITAYDKHAIEAFELCALDYLLKPFDDERIKKTIKRIAETVNNKQILHQQVQSLGELSNENQSNEIKRFMVRSVGKVEVIDVEDVIWIASSGNYVELHLDSKMVLHRVSLNYLADHLSSDFQRCHRTSIVRISQVKSIESLKNGKYALLMNSGDRVALTQKYKDLLLNKLS